MTRTIVSKLPIVGTMCLAGAKIIVVHYVYSILNKILAIIRLDSLNLGRILAWLAPNLGIIRMDSLNLGIIYLTLSTWALFAWPSRPEHYFVWLSQPGHYALDPLNLGIIHLTLSTCILFTWLSQPGQYSLDSLNCMSYN